MNTHHIYQPISDITVAEVKTFLAANVGKPVTIRINSPGGGVFAGLTVHELLRSHAGKVTTVIDGIGASIASVIFCAGAERLISTGGMIMVHCASSASRGNSEQLVKDAAVLDKVDKSLTEIYTQGTKLPRAKIAEMMKAETWMTASEAVALGFAHKIVAGQKIAASWTTQDFPQLPTAAKIAAGLAPTRRDTSAELDRLKSENLLLKQKLTGKAAPVPPAPEPVRIETPHLDRFNGLKGAMASLYWKEHSAKITAEQNVRNSEEKAIERAKRNSK